MTPEQIKTMTEEYVTYAQAKALKVSGFDWECDHYYTPENTTNGYQWFTSGEEQNYNEHGLTLTTSAPTQALAQKWLRDVKGVDIIVTLFRDIDARVEPYKISRLYEVEICAGRSDLYAGEYFPDYEAALSAGIDAALELIKQK